jgi:hypothetical protein
MSIDRDFLALAAGKKIYQLGAEAARATGCLPYDPDLWTAEMRKPASARAVGTCDSAYAEARYRDGYLDAVKAALWPYRCNLCSATYNPAQWGHLDACTGGLHAGGLEWRTCSCGNGLAVPAEAV